MTGLALLFVLASGDLCASRSVQCLAACHADALCVARCSRFQATCEKNRGAQERVALPRKCFDPMGSPIVCASVAAKPPDLSPEQLERLQTVAKVTLARPWKK